VCGWFAEHDRYASRLFEKLTICLEAWNELEANDGRKGCLFGGGAGCLD
jgi:hypothetical protein